MAYPSNPLRNEAEEFIRAEIARVGPERPSRGAIVRRFVERGASKPRVHAWIAALANDAKNPPPDTLEADLAVAGAAIAAAQTAKVLDSLPGASADLARVQEAVQGVIQQPSSPARPTFPLPAPERTAPAPRLPAEASPEALDTLPSLVPDSAQGILEHLRALIETIRRVITYSHGADGKIKNPWMALASADTLRKALETALKLYEAINNIQIVERFTAEVLEEIRQPEPDRAKAVIARMRAVTGRWAAAAPGR